MFYMKERFLLFGSVTDSAWGGTCERLVEELNKLNRVDNQISTYFFAIFILYAINHIIQSPCDKYFSKDGVKKYMHCSCYIYDMH